MPDKMADIVVISTKRALSASPFRLGTAVIHSAPADVGTTIENGQIKRRRGQLVGMNPDLIHAKAKTGF